MIDHRARLVYQEHEKEAKRGFWLYIYSRPDGGRKIASIKLKEELIRPIIESAGQQATAALDDTQNVGETVIPVLRNSKGERIL